MSAPQKIIGMVKDVKRMIDEEEIDEENLKKGASIMVNYDEADFSSLFSPEESLCGLGFLIFLKTLYQYIKDRKGKDYIAKAKETGGADESSDGGSSDVHETGPLTDEIMQAIAKIESHRRSEQNTEVGPID